MAVRQVKRELQDLIRVIAQKSVGWIKKYDVRAAGLRRIRSPRREIEPLEEIAGNDPRSLARFDRGDVLAQSRQRRSINFKERHKLRTATERFQPHAAGAGEA